MKKIVMLLLFTTTYCYSQVEDSVAWHSGISTTEAEYVYLTKGYGPQVIDQAGDLKKGYIMEGDDEGIRSGDYTFIFKQFFREKTMEMCAMLVIAKSSVSGRRYYWCIPVGNYELQLRYFKDLEMIDGTMSREYAKVMSLITMNALQAFLKEAK